MSRNNPFPGARLLLYLGGLVGLYRATGQALDEAGAGVDTIDPSTHFEPQDIHPTSVLLTGIGILLAVWAVVLVLYPLFTYFQYARTGGQDPSKVLVYVPAQPPPPRNLSNSYRNLDVFRAQEDEALASYRWVDRSKGIVSIPIGRAIQILSQRGLPPTKPGGKEYYPPSAGSLLTGLEDKVEPQPR